MAGKSLSGASMSMSCGPGLRFMKVTTGLYVSRNSLSAEEVSEIIMSTRGNKSRMLSSVV